MSRFDKLTLSLALLGVALELVLYFIPNRWIELYKKTADFGLILGFVLFGTSGVMLLTILFPDEWARTMAPKVMIIVGASLALGGVIWQFSPSVAAKNPDDFKLEVAQANTAPPLNCQNSVGGNNTAPMTNNCGNTIVNGPPPWIFNDRAKEQLLSKLPKGPDVAILYLQSDSTGYDLAVLIAEYLKNNGYTIAHIGIAMSPQPIIGISIILADPKRSTILIGEHPRKS